MSEIIEAVKVLAQWPFVEGFFIIVISFLGIMTYKRGEKDRRTLGPAAIEIPLFLMSGPLADAIGAVHDLSEQSRRTNDLLENLINEVREQNRLMEWAGNQAGLQPPPGRKR